jgi:hypothetical protein
MVRHKSVRRSHQKVSAKHQLTMMLGDTPLWKIAAACVVALPLALLSAVNSAAHKTSAVSGPRWTGALTQAPGAPLRPVLAAIARNPQRQDLKRNLDAARASVSIAPLHGPALGVAGLGYDAARRPTQALRAMQQADHLSRREGVAQYWLINHAIRGGDAVAALRHYDALLLTLPTAGQPLLQQMAMVTTVPQGRAAMRPYVRVDNPWFDDFLASALTTLPRAAPLGQLIEQSPRLPDQPALRPYMGELVRRLAAEKDYALLARIYPRLAHTDATALRSVALNSATVDTGYLPVSWDLGSESDFGASLVQAERGGGFAIEAFSLPGVRGITARKLVFLSPGAHQLRWRVSDKEVNRNALANWRLSCGATNQGVDSSSILAGQGVQTMAFTVGANCPAWTLELMVAGGDGVSPSRVIVEDVAITRQGG